MKCYPIKFSKTYIQKYIRHDIAEILLKLALNTNQSIIIISIKLTLSFSNSDLQMLQYREYVKWSYKCFKRTSKLSDFSALSIDSTNRLMNQVKEYWYIGSMLAKSAIEKNRIVECTAIGVYPIRA